MKYKRKVPTVEAFQLNRDAEINAPGWFARAVKKEMIYFDRCITDGATAGKNKHDKCWCR